MPKTGPRRLALALLASCAFIATGYRAQAQTKTIVTLAYGSEYVFDTNDFAKKWYDNVKAAFEKKYPDAEVKLVPIPGGYPDIINKLSLLYRSRSTAPDVAQLPTPALGQFQSSGWLLPMDDQLATAGWWKEFPDAIKAEGQFDGKVYAVSTGENDSQLYYNKAMFKQAGLPDDWQPKTWDDILTAARAIKAKVPGVVPLWLNVGTSSGDNGLLQGTGNLLNGSSDATIQDANGKWVVDSKGLREVLTFVKTMYNEGLGDSLSDLFSPSAVTVPLALFQKGKLAIAVGSNYYGGNWTKTICSPCWAEAPQTIGVVAIPTVQGAAPGAATTLGGWDLAIGAATTHKDYAWKLLDVMEEQQNQIDAANWAGFVPAAQSYTKAASFVDFAPPYNAVSAQVLPFGKLTPAKAEYEVWSHALQQATGNLAQHTDMTVDQAIDAMKSYVSNQLGADQIATR
ncbi:extracellular solute-binding protein [Acidisoma cellulosilytica]|uniref:Extracellular solute-binding protein n=1 Tax=Acidisoma cellulosilyticum TaxID=2802395 RepID=A0A964E6H2_9PROT|nr:extracellular solute-binding protein [Acidisoma cellulosilyticum]MCB8883589.1 extracellular solute-binding protein [Acidisoma cellulosilyticum]